MDALRERQRVDDRAVEPRPGRPGQLHVQEGDVECGVVDHDGRAAYEGEQLVGDGAEQRLVLEIPLPLAMHLRGLLGDVALRVDEGVERAAGRNPFDDLDGADLDDPVAGRRV